MEKFQNKYRIPSARAFWWDYGWNGLYFITICTHQRIHFFGDIVETRLIASPLGEIAETYWHEIPKQFPFAQLGEFVVMPNHIHGIIAIDKPPVETRFIASPNPATIASPNPATIASPNPATIASPNPATIASPNPATTASPNPINPDYSVDNQENEPDTRSIASLPVRNAGGFAGAQNPMLQENLSRVVRWYKGRTTFESRKIHADFAWQTRFHDHIIRNETDYQNIAEYIMANPGRWSEDKLYAPL